ncbi:MAG: hypothetical protein E7206_10405 [Clostridium beijerinckii]|nr:hypothetical protein [Clostridium beijerinckii]
MENDLSEELRKEIDELVKETHYYEKIINKCSNEGLIRHLQSERSMHLSCLQMLCSDNGLNSKDYYKPLEKHIITDEERSILENIAAEANCHKEELENIDKKDPKYKLVEEEKERAIEKLKHYCEKWDVWDSRYYKEEEEDN